MRSGLLISTGLAVAIIAYNELVKLQRVPRPENFSYIALIWAVLGIIAQLGAYEIATAMGFGIVLAMLYTYILSGAPPLTGNTARRIPGGNETKHS